MLRSAAKILSIAIVLAMMLGAFAVVMPALSAPAASAATGEVNIADPVRMDGGTEFRDQKVDLEAAINGLMAVNGAALAKPGNIYENGSIAWYFVGSRGKWAWNETDATPYMLFEKRAESQNCELWTATDLTFPEGDARNIDPGRITITNAQAQYMVDHYQNVIYPNMTDFFGLPPQIDGSNNQLTPYGSPYFGTNVSGRVMIMVFNVVDDSFWNSAYPSYVAGFYNGARDKLYDRNIIHVDCWDWNNRTTGVSARPWVYESTVAHEYQHLLNDYFNPEQASFVNEGCSMYAEILCGYGMDINTYVDRFFYTPDLSLTDWAQQGGINGLAPYGASGLFAAYLADHFGPEMIQAMVHSLGTSGIDTINFAFQEIGVTGWDFNKVFQYWRLANLILSDTPGNGWFNYKSIDPSSGVMGGPRVHPWMPYYNSSVDSAGMFFGTTVTYDGYTTGIRNPGAYGTDYIYVQSPFSGAWSVGMNPDDLKFLFQGQPEVHDGWQMADVPVGTGKAIYTQDFSDGFDGWTTYSAGSDVSPWYIENSGGHYWAEVDGFYTDVYQNERLYSPTIDLWDYTKAILSFDVEYKMGNADYDYAYLAYSVEGGTYKVLQYFLSDYGGTITLDISDLTGLDVNFRFSFISYGPDMFGAPAYMTVDNFVISDVTTSSGWWSGKGDLKDFSLYADLDLTGMESAILTLDTAWDIEPYWDFGFVQVSADGGESWTSVANGYTTTLYEDGAMESIIDNLPGITGNSGGYVAASWDLSEWVDQSVMLRLRYMTDTNTNGAGWFVRGANLNKEAIALDAWTSGTPIAEVSWIVTLYFPGAVGLESQVWMLPIMTTLSLQETTQMAIRTIASFTEYPEFYILVSPTVSNSDYSFGMGSFGMGPD